MLALMFFMSIFGCSKSVGIHTETYKLDNDAFTFNGVRYSTIDQLTVVGENIYVDMIPLTRYGYLNTSYKGPYSINIGIDEMKSIRAYIDSVEVYGYVSGKLFYSEAVKSELTPVSDIPSHRLVLNDALNTNDRSIIVRLSIRLERAEIKEYTLLFKFDLDVVDDVIEIQALTV